MRSEIPTARHPTKRGSTKRDGTTLVVIRRDKTGLDATFSFFRGFEMNNALTQRPDGFSSGGNNQVARRSGAATADATSAERVAEVQAVALIAQNRPRDSGAALADILDHCRRARFAEKAQYAYPRGDTVVTGPSIHLARTMAASWGNIKAGWRVVGDIVDGVATVEAYCWDAQSNTRSDITFQVKLERSTRRGKYALTDDRDIYEHIANFASRRLRACILAIIPEDVAEVAVEQCEQTLKDSAGDKPIGERLKKVLEAFAEFGVTAERIEGVLGHNLDATTEPELVGLRKRYAAIKDGMAKADDVFPPVKSDTAPDAQKSPATTAGATTLDEAADAMAGEAQAESGESGGDPADTAADKKPETNAEMSNALGKWPPHGNSVAGKFYKRIAASSDPNEIDGICHEIDGSPVSPVHSQRLVEFAAQRQNDLANLDAEGGEG